MNFVSLDSEEWAAPTLHQGAFPDTGPGSGSDLNGEGMKGTRASRNLRSLPPKKPEAAFLVQLAHIPCPVPTDAHLIDLVLCVVSRIEIPLVDMHT